MKIVNYTYKKILYILILIFIISHLILIKQVISTIKALSKSNIVNVANSYSKKLIGEKLPFYELIKENHYFDDNSKFVILFLFSIYDCNSCISSIIPSLNQSAVIYRKYGCILYGIVETKGRNIRPFKETLDIQFPLLKNENLRSFLKERGIFKTPIFIFGNIKSNKCIYSFSPGEENTGIINFYKFIDVFFESVGKKDRL